jgi:putative methanogenesis marker protein 6
MSEERETRLFMISPDSMITPDQLVREVHAMGKEVTAKETCYGSVVEGPRKEVREVLAAMRAKYPYEIYSKTRAFPAGDPRRCRAHHGTRPGFAQLEAEWEALNMIKHGLKSCDKGEKFNIPKEREKLPVEDFKKICEASR